MDEVKGRVGIPAEYFLKMAKHDYTSYREALPREFYQNSIDAGATYINVEFNDQEKSITVTDDGCGMDRDTILNKLLVLGGSHKREGSVGAFGKAKELLFFSWLKYEIHTNNLKVEGCGDAFSLYETSETFPGTRAKIYITEEEYSGLQNYFYLIAKRNETNCRIIVNGKEIECEFKKGNHLRSIPFGDFYLQKGQTDHYYHVRINGIWMFSRYIEGNELGGRLILELNKSSLELLTSNRDGMKYPHQRELDKVTNEIVIDTLSFLKPEKKKIRKLIKGLGRAMSLSEFRENINQMLSFDFEEGIKTISKIEGLSLPLLRDRIEKINNHIFDEYEAAFWASYKPNFVVLYEQSQSKEVDKFLLSKKAEKLAYLWTEVIKQVIIDNEMFGMDFTAGFTFDESSNAAIETDNDNIPIIYLNPTKLGENAGIKLSNLLSNRKLLIELLKDSAIHEIAHIETPYHSEYFVTVMERLRTKTHLNEKAYNFIAKMKI